MYISRILIIGFLIATATNAMEHAPSKPTWITDLPEKCTFLEPKWIVQLPEDLQKKFFSDVYDVSIINMSIHYKNGGFFSGNALEFFGYSKQIQKSFVPSYYEKVYFPIKKNELFILTLQFLQRGISLTYKKYPYVALCIYKQLHKNKDRFEAIASGILSEQQWITPLLGDTLFKVLGSTIHAKIAPYKEAKNIVVENFKELLRKKATYFLFPTRQIATSGSLEEPKHFGTISSYEDHSQKSIESKAVNSSTQWSWHSSISGVRIFKLFKNDAQLRARFGNPLIAIKAELLCTYDGPGFKNHGAITAHDIATEIWFSSTEKSFFIKQYEFEESTEKSMLDINFHALYTITPQTEKDTLMHALLYTYVKKIDNRSSSFYQMLYSKADSDTTHATIATVYNHDTKGSLWKTVVSYICPISNLFFGTQNYQETIDIPDTSLIDKVLVYEHDTYSECPNFWYIHNRSKQHKKAGYKVRLNSSYLKTLIYLEPTITGASGQ